MHFLKKFHDKTIKYDFINAFNFNANFSQNLPKLKKIILNFSFKTNNIKKFSSSLLALEIITKQRSKLVEAKKANIFLKIRKGDPIGCSLTIKKKNLFNFLNKIVMQVLPKFTKFFFIKTKSNIFTCHVGNVFYFSELKSHYTYFFNLSELKVSVVTANLINYRKFNFFLRSLQFPIFRKL